MIQQKTGLVIDAYFSGSKVRWLLDNQEDAAQMGATGRKTVEEHFSLDVLSPRLAGYLKGLAGRE